jgi:hypothetical protein
LRIPTRPLAIEFRDGPPRYFTASGAVRKFDRLPSQTLPRKTAKPVKRLSSLAQALSRDALQPNARKAAYAELFGVLDGLSARFKDKVEDATYRILEVEGETLVTRCHGGLRHSADPREVHRDR